MCHPSEISVAGRSGVLDSSDEACTMCEFTLHFIQEQLQDKSTKVGCRGVILSTGSCCERYVLDTVVCWTTVECCGVLDNCGVLLCAGQPLSAVSWVLWFSGQL